MWPSRAQQLVREAVAELVRNIHFRTTAAHARVSETHVLGRLAFAQGNEVRVQLIHSAKVGHQTTFLATTGVINLHDSNKARRVVNLSVHAPSAERLRHQRVGVRLIR